MIENKFISVKGFASLSDVDMERYRDINEDKELAIDHFNLSCE